MEEKTAMSIKSKKCGCFRRRIRTIHEIIAKNKVLNYKTVECFEHVFHGGFSGYPVYISTQICKYSLHKSHTSNYRLWCKLYNRGNGFDKKHIWSSFCCTMQTWETPEWKHYNNDGSVTIPEMDIDIKINIE